MKKIFIVLLSIACFQIACKKEEGCTDKAAKNYNSEAEKDDGSCTYESTDTTTTTDTTKQEPTNQELIVGDWDKIEKYYVDNVDGIKQYAPSQAIYMCNDTTTIEYTPLYVVESISWKFNADGSFTHLELGKTYSPTSSACSDGNNPDNYYGEDVVKKTEGTYEISEGGKGNTITFYLNNGDAYFTASILKLDETSIDFEYDVEGVKQRYIMKK